MVIRGAPAIGVAAAMGIALGACARTRQEARRALRSPVPHLRRHASHGGEPVLGDRPHARRVRRRIGTVRRTTLRAARSARREAIHDEDIAANRRMGAHGAALIPDGATVLTHCNAGALATAGYGTALGVIRAAREAGKKVSVIACETRPFLQGARLTAWELKRDRIPVTLITDSMAANLMQRGRDRLRRRRRRPCRGQRRRRQQDRHVHACGRGPSSRHPVLRRGADLDGRPGVPARCADTDRGASGARGDAPLRPADRAERRQDREPGVRRHAARAGHRDHHRARRSRGRRTTRRSPGSPATGPSSAEPRDRRRAGVETRGLAARVGAGVRPSRSRRPRRRGTRSRSASTSSSIARRASCTARCGRSIRGVTPTASRPPGSRSTSTRR